MFELRSVHSGDEARLLQFELENRIYFAETISDRGDEYFDEFHERHLELLAEQKTGAFAYYVLIDDDETVAGRFNLYNLITGTASVGYRVSQRVSGHGVATLGLAELCNIAREKHGIGTLSATTSDENVASQRVLVKVGFVPLETAVVAGKRGIRFELELGSD